MSRWQILCMIYTINMLSSLEHAYQAMRIMRINISKCGGDASMPHFLQTTYYLMDNQALPASLANASRVELINNWGVPISEIDGKPSEFFEEIEQLVSPHKPLIPDLTIDYKIIE